MRLGTKFLALLLCTIITPIIIVVGITYSTINKSITQIESDKGEQNVTNTIKYMESLVNSQKNSMYSWLPWTDLYTAVNDKNITWLKENVLISEKDNTQNEVLLILDKNFNPIAFSDKAPKEWHNTNLKNLSVVKELNSTTPFASDVLLTKNSAFIIAIGKICVNEDTKFQNPNGYIITAQKITPTLISTGANIINAHITLKFNNGYIVSSTDNPDTNKRDSTIIETNNKTMIIDAERNYTNSLNEPIGVLHIETTSSTGLNALSTLTTASISLILIILVLSIITFLWLKYKVTTPINNVINIINQKDLSQRVNVSGKDEISILAKAFNGFTHSLKANFK
ncbi:MAG: CHASE4 domain-containing protein, partial [Clostridium sp.]